MHRCSAVAAALTRTAVLAPRLYASFLCKEMRIAVIRVACTDLHAASQASSILASQHGAVLAQSPAILEPKSRQDYVLLDDCIACGATTWAGYLLMPQVEVADGCVILVANAPHHIVRVQ